MPMTRKRRSGGRGAGAPQPSGTYRKRKGPEAHGPGLREAEELIGRQRAKGEHHTTIERMAITERFARAHEAAEKAISNPRPLPKRKAQAYAPTRNYRIVRRVIGKGEYLVIAEVEYLNAKPYQFNTVGGPPSTELKPLPGVRILDAEGIVRLRAKLDEMLTAFAQPVLDERDDFGRK